MAEKEHCASSIAKTPSDHLNDTSFATRAIHAGQSPTQWTSRCVVPPIVLATTYKQFGPADHAGYEYTRSGNPTRDCVEQAIAAMEGAKYGLVFSSGLSALNCIYSLLNAGDHVVSFDDVYGGTGRYMRKVAARMGIETDFEDLRDANELKRAIKPNTKLIWLETPTNPLMRLVDIRAAVDVARAINPKIIVVVDNTFLTPYFQKPLYLGADLVIHSCSKYINGHSDVIMGAIATNNKELYDQLHFLQNSIGAVPSPMDCFLCNRGLKTLALRMKACQRNGLAVAKFLESHPAVEKVVHPGLPSHPQHDIAKKQHSGNSGMVCCYIKGGLEQTTKFLKCLKFIALAESLGAVESLVCLPSLMTHASVPPELRAKLGITDNYIRFSIGCEATEDIIEDLRQAFEAAART